MTPVQVGEIWTTPDILQYMIHFKCGCKFKEISLLMEMTTSEESKMKKTYYRLRVDPSQVVKTTGGFFTFDQ